MNIGETSEGEFVERNEDESNPKNLLDKKNAVHEVKNSQTQLLPVTDDTDSLGKRTIYSDGNKNPDSKQTILLENDKIPVTKREISSEKTHMKSHSLVVNDDSFAKKRRRRSLDEGSEPSEKQNIESDIPVEAFGEKNTFAEQVEKRVHVPGEVQCKIVRIVFILIKIFITFSYD